MEKEGSTMQAELIPGKREEQGDGAHRFKAGGSSQRGDLPPKYEGLYVDQENGLTKAVMLSPRKDQGCLQALARYGIGQSQSCLPAIACNVRSEGTRTLWSGFVRHERLGSPQRDRICEGRQQLRQVQGVAHVCPSAHGPTAWGNASKATCHMAAQPECCLSVREHVWMICSVGLKSLLRDQEYGAGSMIGIMFREHSDWVEALVVVQTTLHDRPVEEIFSAGADGKLLRWQLDAEQNCDIYECIVGPLRSHFILQAASLCPCACVKHTRDGKQGNKLRDIVIFRLAVPALLKLQAKHRCHVRNQEEIPLHKKNIYAIVFYKEQNCLITGGEDTTIQLYYLSGEVPTFNDVPLPTSFTVSLLHVSNVAPVK
eukprot:1159235-Pelagomonas_calceolata.AAC.9